MSSTGLDTVLVQMWASFAPLAAGRVDVLERYAAQLSNGQDDPVLRVPAASAAHQLAGALGSYGRPGSDEAAELEVLLRDPTAVRDAGTVQAHVAALRAAVTA